MRRNLINILTLSILLALSALFPAAGCGIIGEIKEANYRSRGDKMSLGDANDILMPAMYLLSTRCPNLDGYTMALWGLFTGCPAKNSRTFINSQNIPNKVYKFFDKIVEDCSDYKYVDKADVELCFLMVNTYKCAGTSPASDPEYPLIVLGACQKVYNSQ